MEISYLRASVASALSSMRPAFARRFVLLYFAAALLIVGLGGLFFGGLPGSFAAAAATCTPNSSYALPSTLSLTDKPAGLTVTDDGDSYYDVYGTNRDTIAAGLNACAPRFAGIKTYATYLAYTSYNVGWSYGVIQDSDGTCRLSDVKVGLHLSQIYPRLASLDAPTGVTDKWRAFITGTEEHENGHLRIDKDLAANLLTELQGIDTSCATVNTSAIAITAKYTNLYSSKNHDHDTDTDYGHTQGAVW